LDDMGVSKLSAKVFFFKVNYSFNFKEPFKPFKGSMQGEVSLMIECLAHKRTL